MVLRCPVTMRAIDNIWSNTSTHCIATWHEVMIALWWGTATPADVARMARIAGQLNEEKKGAACFLLVVMPSSPPPVGPSFAEFVRFSRDTVSRMAAAVAVAEGGSFRNAMIRNVAATLSLALPIRIPYKFAESLEQAAVMLGPHLSREAKQGAGLVGAVNELKAHSVAGQPPR